MSTLTNQTGLGRTRLRPQQFQPHIPGLPSSSTAETPKGKPSGPDPKLDRAIIAVGKELIAGRTYLLFGNGTYVLLRSQDRNVAERLAGKREKAVVYYEEELLRRPDTKIEEPDDPPNQSRWYWVHWPEVRERRLEYVINDLQDGRKPKR